MTIVIKSDQVATQSLGNIYGINAALDFEVMLDFNRENYVYRDSGQLKNIALADAITLTRASKATYKDRDNTTQVADVNQPRIHFMQDMGLQGLLIEGERENLLTGTSTQTITVSTAGILQALALSVEGTGSATMSGGVQSLTSVSATEGNPQGALPITGSGTASVTVTVTGSVTKLQLERTPSTTGGNYASTFMADELTKRKADVVALSTLLTTKLGSTGTVVCQYVYQDRLVAGFNEITGIFTIEDSTKPKGGIYFTRELAKTTGSASQTVTAVAPSSSTIEKDNKMPSLSNRKITSALVYDKGVDMAQGVNGSIKDVTGTSTQLTPDHMSLGGDYTFSSATGGAGAILTRLAIYSRKLSRDELAKISTSWL